MPITAVIVDDEPLARKRIRKLLQTASDVAVVGEAADGEEALRLADEQRPQVMFLDVQMPRMDGFEFCRRLKANPALRDIPLILLTSLSSPQDIIRGLASGADNFVVKPYDESFLLARIRASEA